MRFLRASLHKIYHKANEAWNAVPSYAVETQAHSHPGHSKFLTAHYGISHEI